MLFSPLDLKVSSSVVLLFSTDPFLITSEYFKGTGKARLADKISQVRERRLWWLYYGISTRKTCLALKKKRASLCKISVRHLFQSRELSMLIMCSRNFNYQALINKKVRKDQV